MHTYYLNPQDPDKYLFYFTDMLAFPFLFSTPVTALYSLKYRDKNLFAEVLFAHPTCPSALVYFMNMYFPMF